MNNVIFLFLLLLLWGSVSLAMSLWFSGLIPNPRWRKAFMMVMALIFFASPFVDEVIGKYQFEALCKANGIESADVSKARGKRVKAIYSERRLIERSIVPINVSDHVFQDVDSGEVLIQSKDYYAMGGWFMRYTPVREGLQNLG